MAAEFVGDIDVTGNIAVSGTVDGRDVAADGVTLDAVQGLLDAQKALSWTYVDARADAGTARPTGWAGVIWLCDVTGDATNAAIPDIIVREDLAV
jgi:hypothetical protein